MGIFGKLFEKKECSVCGGEIGLLGNRKLEDGNLCKECAKKLSPWFDDRRHSTVEQIVEQLEYREANRAKVEEFCVTRTLGEGMKVLIDEDAGLFINDKLTLVFTMTTMLFGGPMGFLFGLMRQSALLGIISGIFAGCLFTLLIFLFVKVQEKKFDKKRLEIAKERNIVCDGGATVQGNGGWMFFTEDGLEFYPHQINISRKNLMIPINTISSVKTDKNRLIVESIDNLTFAIVVSHNKEWVEQIKQYIKN